MLARQTGGAIRSTVRSRLRLGAAVTTAAVVAAISGSSAHQAEVPGNREVFDVSLERTSGNLLMLRGRTVVETRTGCGAIHTVQRSLAEAAFKEGPPVRTDFVSETWESSDGRALRFRVRSTQSSAGTERHEGTARLAPDGSGRVNFTSKDKSIALPRGTMFPGAFGRAMIEAAQQGRNLDNHPVFLGGKALVTAAVKIGRPLARPQEGARDPAHLLQGAAWPVLISYFPDRADLPASEVAVPLYANGLLGSLSLIYPGYSFQAKLVRVERLPSSC